MSGIPTHDRSRPRIVLLPILAALVLGLTIAACHTARATPHVVWHAAWHDARFTPQTQEHAMWCAPASASISLDSIGIHRGQTAIARAAGTTFAGGTSDSARYVEALNSAAAPAGVTYSETVEPSAASLGELLTIEIDHGAVAIQPTWTDLLPYYPHGTAHAGHVITVVAVDPGARQVRVWDPLAGPTHGLHVLSYAQLYAASQGPGLAYVMTTTASTR